LADLWAAAKGLLGRWEGPATGRPGRGHQVREYKLILGDHFILGSDVTDWEPTADEPAGLHHEGLGVMSFDRSSGQLMMRSFYSEGFVHEYRCGEPAGEGSKLIFEAAQVEGGPPGMRARETIDLVSADTLESTFELAMPGGEFESYTFERLTRQPA
jgi:hypothetical protein